MATKTAGSQMADFAMKAFTGTMVATTVVTGG
jgi:hypothetical protein